MKRLLLVLALVLPAAAGAQPPTPFTQSRQGEALYNANCLRCHGDAGRGTSNGPSLRNAGRLAADFYLRTGYMPIAEPGEQPDRRRPPFDEQQLDALVGYVASLGNGPAVPTPRPEGGDVALGLRLFTDHCAGCHQAVADGGYVTGARVPPLGRATPTQIAEAVRIGPYLMPRFSERDITPAQLDSIVRYVQLTQHPPDRGGWGIGNLGPFPEGMVTWLLAAVALIGTCMLIGRRLGS